MYNDFQTFPVGFDWKNQIVVMRGSDNLTEYVLCFCCY